MMSLIRWDKRRGWFEAIFKVRGGCGGEPIPMNKIAFAMHHMENQTIGGA